MMQKKNFEMKNFNNVMQHFTFYGEPHQFMLYFVFIPFKY